MSKDELIATIEKAFGVTSHDQYPRFLEYIGMSLARCADAMEAERKPTPTLMPVPVGMRGILVIGNKYHVVPIIGCHLTLVDDEPEYLTHYVMLNGSTTTYAIDVTGTVFGMDTDIRGERLEVWIMRNGVEG